MFNNFCVQPAVKLILTLYVILALIVAAVLSPLSLSFVPVLLLLWYIFQWCWKVSAVTGFITQFFMFFAIGLLFSLRLGPYFATLIALPLLVIINRELLHTGRLTRPGKKNVKRTPTNLAIIVTSITLVLLAISLILFNLSLLLAAGVIIIYLLVITIVVIRRIPAQPVVARPVQLRVVAGDGGQCDVTLEKTAKSSGMLFLQSPELWYRVAPNDFIPVVDERIKINVIVTPSLSGKKSVTLRGWMIDPWGLMQIEFEIEPVQLLIIPRARYAGWLAQKYLKGTTSGNLPLLSSVGNIRTLKGLREGVEFYGNTMYQPGDSMQHIDWKHTVKFNELVRKEFTEVRVQPGIMLINLVAGNDEEMDNLAYNILVTAVCLARDNIPTAIAAYDENGVKLLTDSLTAQKLVAGALQAEKCLILKPNYTRYLNPPDVNRLKGNITRLGQVQNQSVRVLGELLQFEYKSLVQNAGSHPCTQAINESLTKTSRRSTVIIISLRNHDAGALAFNEYNLAGKGNSVISL